MTKVFRVFPNDKIDTLKKAYGPYLHTKKFGKLLDTTAGLSGYAILGWSNPKVMKGIYNQLKKFINLN